MSSRPSDVDPDPSDVADQQAEAQAQPPGKSSESPWIGLQRYILSAAPIAPLAVGLMAGIILSQQAKWNLGFFVGLLSAASLAAFVQVGRIRFLTVLILLGGVGAGGTWHWSRERAIHPRSVEHLLGRERLIVRLRGAVVSPPAVYGNEASAFTAWQHREETTSFLLRVEELEGEAGWEPAQGTLKVSVREAVLDLVEGDVVETFGRLAALRPPKNPGGFDWRGYYHQQGITARLYCDQRENIKRLERRPPGVTSWLRTKFRGLLTDDIAASAPEEASFLEAMVLGHRSRFDRRLNDVFTRAGCVHFIAASGTNIVILMSAVWFAGRLVGFDKRRCAWFMVLSIVLYGMVAEARPPILRACVMGLMFCSALMLQRATSHFNWISAAAVILCLMDPMMVFDAGFQLSFAAVFGVAYLAPALMAGGTGVYWWFRSEVMKDPYLRADLQLRHVAERFAPQSSGRRMARFGWKCVRAVGIVFAVSLGAWLCGLPITLAWFQQLQIWGVLSSLAVYPLMSMIMVLGLVKVAVAAVSPTLAWLVSAALGLIDRVMIGVVERFAELPGTNLFVPPPPWWLILTFYMLIVAAVFWCKSLNSAGQAGKPRIDELPRSRRWQSQGLLATIPVLVLTAGAWRLAASQPRGLTVTVLAVGAGSAMVIELPDGTTMLYDAGSLDVPKVAESVLIPFFRYRGIHSIDRVYVSHPNLDHFGGLPDLIGNFAVGPVVWNHCFLPLADRGTPARRFVETLEAHDHTTRTLGPEKTWWESGGVRFERLWPPEDCTGLSANDSSTVLRLTFLGHSLLITGDIETEAQRGLMAGGDVYADVLVLPHHGSVCTTTAGFIQQVAAETLIRSSGQDSAQTDNGLMNLVRGFEYFNTADHGAVTIHIDEHGLHISPWLGE